MTWLIRSLARMALGIEGGLTRASASNALGTLHYLVRRRLGLPASVRLEFAVGGRSHVWSVQRREDLSVLQEVFVDRTYELPSLDASVVVDLGANIGAASVYFANRWPESRVLAVEASSREFAHLLANTGAYERVTAVNCAVAATDGPVRFEEARCALSGQLAEFSGSQGEAGRIVQGQRLSSLLRDYQLSSVDLLKFDVEGAEQFVLSDSEALDRVGAFIGEVHPDLMTVPTDGLLEPLHDRFALTATPLEAGRLLVRGKRHCG